MARFFVPRKQLRDNRGIITGQELEHLRKVLRLATGDRVVVFDDTGWEHEAVIRALSPAQGEIEIVKSHQTERESPLQVTLAVGLTKGEKIDFVVEKATELGVQKIIPFTSRYAVPKFDERKIAARTERWRKIALSATKQSGRTQAPEVLPLCNLRELLVGPWPDALKLLFWEKEAQQSLAQLQENQHAINSVVLAIGPEGGFSVEEAELARAHGFALIRLGRRILRAETAAVTALSLVQFIWGDLR
jgi:16S rRNA (uracil1498-N3)-methyltransferase